MKLSISEILEKASQFGNVEQKAVFLQQHDSQALRVMLKLPFDKDLKWALPEGRPPFTPYPGVDAHGRLYSEIRRLYLFMDGGPNNLPKAQREQMFINLLESLDPKDAELLVAAKDKAMPYPEITKEVVSKAFPGLVNG